MKRKEVYLIINNNLTLTDTLEIIHYLNNTLNPLKVCFLFFIGVEKTC